jgi:carbamoyltransferase
LVSKIIRPLHKQLKELGAIFEIMDEPDLISITAEAIAMNKVVGWFQGRMEFGPRALGARSILGNPRSADMQRIMNLKIKNRESFRPFAPAVLAKDANDIFDLEKPSPYMLIVSPLHENQRFTPNTNMSRANGLDRVNEVRADIPAVVHVDYSARIQTVDGRHNPIFYSLIKEFYNKTGCPIVINTSFNVRGEPIVESPKNAFTCFMRTEMDYLVIGPYFLEKSKQASWIEKIDWKTQYELD